MSRRRFLYCLQQINEKKKHLEVAPANTYKQTIRFFKCFLVVIINTKLVTVSVIFIMQPSVDG